MKYTDFVRNNLCWAGFIGVGKHEVKKRKFI